MTGLHNEDIHTEANYAEGLSINSQAEGESFHKDGATEVPRAFAAHERAFPHTAQMRAREPHAETGMIRAVTLPMEGEEMSERQDAMRTTAETRPVVIPARAQFEDTRMISPSVLIVEDQIELADVLEYTLHRMNMVTARESHGSRAFARYNEMQPDIILLDIGLPDIAGWQVLDSIKARVREIGSKMPVIIVITALGDPANRVVGKLQGVHSYIVKPFTTDEVERAVRSALSSAAG